MKRINDIKIGTRLNLIFNLAFIVIIGLLGIYTIVTQRKQITADTETRMYEQVNDMATIIIEQVAQSQKTTENALKVGVFSVFNSGKLTTSGQTISVEAKNQVTKEAQQVQIKQV